MMVVKAVAFGDGSDGRAVGLGGGVTIVRTSQ